MGLMGLMLQAMGQRDEKWLYKVAPSSTVRANRYPMQEDKYASCFVFYSYQKNKLNLADRIIMI